MISNSTCGRFCSPCGPRTLCGSCVSGFCGMNGSNERKKKAVGLLLHTFRFDHRCSVNQLVVSQIARMSPRAVRCRQLAKIERRRPVASHHKSARTGSYYRGEITLTGAMGSLPALAASWHRRRGAGVVAPASWRRRPAGETQAGRLCHEDANLPIAPRFISRRMIWVTLPERPGESGPETGQRRDRARPLTRASWPTWKAPR